MSRQQNAGQNRDIKTNELFEEILKFKSLERTLINKTHTQ
jgi:hypothetical protein